MITRHRFSFFILLVSVALSILGASSTARAQTPSPAPPPNRLQVLTYIVEPFVMKQGDRFTGFSADLWNALARRLGYAYDWVEVNSVDEMIQRAQAGTADVLIGKTIITADREKIMDFSVPYFEAGLRIMVGQPHRSFVIDLLRTIFRPEMLKLLGVAILIVLVLAHLIWLLERGSNDAIPKSYFRGIWESLWWALSIITAFTYVRGETPSSPLKRIIAMALMVSGIILIAEFTAAVTTDLTVRQLGGDISGPDDLPGKKVATISPSVAARYLDEQGILYESVNTIDEAASLLEQGQVDAVVYDGPVLQYYATNNGNGKVRVVGPVFQPLFYGIALPLGSPLLKPINEALLSMLEDGTYEQIYRKWFGAAR